MSIKISFSETTIGDDTEYYMRISNTSPCSECGAKHVHIDGEWYMNISSNAGIGELAKWFRSLADSMEKKTAEVKR